MKYFSRFIILLIASVAVLSCKREGSSVTAPPDEVSDTTTFVDSVDFSPKVGMSVIMGIVNSCKGFRGAPLSGVRVMLDSPLYGTYTDQDGKFSLPATPGRHLVTFSKPPFATVSIASIDVPVKDGNNPNAKPDIIAIPKPVCMAMKPSYMPVNVGYVRVSSNTGIGAFILSYNSKLIDPELRKPGRLVLRMYKHDPSLQSFPDSELVIALGETLVNLNQDRIMIKPAIPFSLIMNTLKMKRGDSLFFRLVFGGYEEPVGCVDRNGEHFKATDVSPESEAIKVVIP